MTNPPVGAVDAGAQQVSRRTTVSAPAADLFAIVADPRRHQELDGSGTVRATVDGPERLSDGATFSVGMKQFGVPYRIRSTVTRFEDGRVVEWRHPAGHRWRWELRPLDEARTEVTETFDYSGLGVRGKALELFGMPRANAKGITATLEGLQRRFG